MPRKPGIKIQSDAVADGRHHLYLIMNADAGQAVRHYFAPFGELGTLDAILASHCGDPFNSGHC